MKNNFEITNKIIPATQNNLAIKYSLFLSLIVLLFTPFVYGKDQPIVTVPGELRAIKTHGYSPPKVDTIWQFTISYMVDDGSVVKKGMPVLMFKTEEIQKKLLETTGKFSIKKSKLKQISVNKTETFEKKSIGIEEKKMKLEKAELKAKLPQSLIASNEYKENQLNYQLAIKQLESAKLDLLLSKENFKVENEILNTELDKLKTDMDNFEKSITSMRMMATTDGVAMHQSNWRNNKFSNGDTVWSRQNVLNVADLSQVIAKLEIPESSIKHIKLNQKVIIKLDSLPDKEFLGRIKEIDKVVRVKSVNQPSKIIKTIVEISKFDAEIMRPGMRLSAKIFTDEQP